MLKIELFHNPNDVDAAMDKIDSVDDFDPDLFSPKIKKIEINVFEDATIAVLEEFETVNHFKYPWYKKNNENDQLFLRNILVKDFTFDSQLMVKTISLVGFTINIYLKDIVPIRFSTGISFVKGSRVKLKWLRISLFVIVFSL